ALGASGQGGEHGVGQVQVADLAAGVHPGVGAAGDGDAGRDTGDPAQRLLELALDGALTRLGRPAVEVGAVIGEVQSQAGRAAAAASRGRGGCGDVGQLDGHAVDRIGTAAAGAACANPGHVPVGQQLFEVTAHGVL